MGAKISVGRIEPFLERMRATTFSAAPGLFDLVLTKSGLDYLYKTLFLLTTPESGSVTWQVNRLAYPSRIRMPWCLHDRYVAIETHVADLHLSVGR